jgi:hypothetical protein
MIYVLMVLELEVGRQKFEKILGMSFREIMKVHRIAASILSI